MINSIPRIALIPATRVAIDPIEDAAKRIWPEAETITILEESLSIDRAKETELSEEMSNRILSVAEYAKAVDVDGVLFTCSAFGQAIDEAAAKSKIPILKPNEAMFDAAFDKGTRISMIYTFAPAAKGMEKEFQEAAKKRGSSAKIKSYFCEGALEAKCAGDNETHNNLIAQTAAGIVNADVILLAQFSMASAVEKVRASTDVLILTSPDAAILKIRKLVEARKRINVSC